MNRFWDIIIRPVIEEIDAKFVVEVGSGAGLNTGNILEYCVDTDGRMVAVDPFPQFDVDQFKVEYGDSFEIFQDISLNCLPLLSDYDVILIDGDPNWYTVYNELKIVENIFGGNGFPLVFLYGVGWPYGRRDGYYDIGNIPGEFRQPYKKLGLFPGRGELLDEGGFNSCLNNAVYENNPKNGVLTGVEDFIRESELDISFEFINAFNGLGILYLKDAEIDVILKRVLKDANLLDVIEKERMKLRIYFSESVKQNKVLKEQLLAVSELETVDGDYFNVGQNRLLNESLDDEKSKVEVLETRLRDVENQLGEADVHLDFLHKKGSYVQKLFSKFPSLYIFLKAPKTGIKNAFVIRKGYKAIEENNLFNVGYYLKNSDDILQSGQDPLLHYLYHGYKEGRKPNPDFNGEYYLHKHGDVKKSNINPLIHYSLHGLKEGRTIGKHFKAKQKTEVSPKILSDINSISISNDKSKFTLIQFTPPKTANPYYHMLEDEFISQGINFKYLTDFHSIEHLLKQHNGCIVHLHQPEPYYHSPNGDEKSTLINSHKFLDNLKHIKTLGAKLVWTMHNPVPHDRKFQEIDEKVNEELFTLSDHIVVLGRYPEKTLFKDQNVKTPISIITHPSFKEVYPPKIDKIQARKELGLPLDAIIFGNIGRIKPYKGYELIIDAFNEVLNHQISSKKLILLFAGNSEEKDYINSIKENPNVIVIEKDLDDSELVMFVSALDYSVFAFKDIWASSTVVLSLSYQVPVIVPDIGCMSDYVFHLDNGFLYEHGNLDSLVKSLECVTRVEYYDHLQYMCAAYLEEKTILNTVNQFIKVYEQVFKESTVQEAFSNV